MYLTFVVLPVSIFYVMYKKNRCYQLVTNYSIDETSNESMGNFKKNYPPPPPKKKKKNTPFP